MNSTGEPLPGAIDDFMKKQGGFLTFDDLSRHHSEWVEPIKTNYRGYDVWELPPNGQGIATLQILNIMEGYDLKITWIWYKRIYSPVYRS